MAHIAPLTGKRILVTGATGMVGGPLAMALAAENTVFGGARFTNEKKREELVSSGATAVRVDLGSADFDEIPDDLDCVLNFAVARSNDWEADFAANVEGVALLMDRCKDVDTFFQCSTAGVYESQGQVPLSETSPLGDSHRAAGYETYSISKIAAESIVQHTATRLGIPTVIARLSVPYGDTFGWPTFQVMMIDNDIPIGVHPIGPSLYAPLHLVDIVGSLPYLLGAASVPATVVNWGGDENVAVEDWCALIGDLVGKEPLIQVDENAIPSLPIDVTRLNGLGFHSSISWQEGIRRLVATSRTAS
ncbi:MAG: NAD(P)-dependent oxidoreductase [Acidimicrobiia bacterium]